MIDYHSSLVSTLKEILPTYYEMNLTSKTTTPCISYLELNNSVEANGDTLGYSNLIYQIKVWGTKLADLQNYANQIDAALRPLGWTRTSCNELYDNKSAMIQKIMTFQAMGLEEFN